jgi:transposase
MRFFTDRYPYYCGVDLHARSMYLCILDEEGEVKLHQNIKAEPDAFLDAIEPFIDHIVVGVECIFTWYWLADLCAEQDIPFVLGHALYMKAIHGGKAKNDRIDSLKIASLLRGGMFPMAYVYPAAMRATRDLLRRRNYLTRKRADLLSHIQNTNSQYNMEPFPERITYKKNREAVAEQFIDRDVRVSIEADLDLINHLDRLKQKLELYILRNAKQHDPQAIYRLRSVPGIGPIISLVILYEIGDIDRFPRVQEFASYARLVKCAKESAGKRYGHGGGKIGSAHLKWAFSEAAVLFLRNNPAGMKYRKQLQRKHGKAKSLSILAHKLGRAVYYMLKRDQAFDLGRFVQA